SEIRGMLVGTIAIMIHSYVNLQLTAFQTRSDSASGAHGRIVAVATIEPLLGHRGRVLQFINIAILLSVVVIVAAVYWIAYRPLPQTSGEISALISKKATIVRDALGVPHISAATLDDALFLQGFVTAQDRLWQMDALRRLAAGELSEVVGPKALEVDKDSRRLRM